MAEEKEKTKKELYIVGEVATQTSPVIVNTKTEETYRVEAAIAKLMNDVEELKGLL
jgi:hypothetical protein